MQQVAAFLFLAGELVRLNYERHYYPCPLKKEITHYHHASKTIWIAASLFLIVCLVSTSWYNTYSKLKMYKANDTQYRDKIKRVVIFEQMVRTNRQRIYSELKYAKRSNCPGKTNQRNFEVWQKSLKLEKEAKQLKQKVNGGVKKM